MKSPAALLLAVAVVAWLIDFLSKTVVLRVLEPGESHQIIGDFVRFTLVFNPGAAFSLGTGFTWIFTVASTAVAVAIVWFSPKVGSLPWAVVLGTLLGGTAGNLTDRLFREPGFPVGHVVDFIQLPFFAIFNVADICISVSVALFVVLTLRGVPIRHESTPVEPGQDDAK